MAVSNRVMSKKLVRHDLFSEVGEFLDSIPASMKRAATEEYKKFLHLKFGNFSLNKEFMGYLKYIVYLVIGGFQPRTCMYFPDPSIFYTFIFVPFFYDFR